MVTCNPSWTPIDLESKLGADGDLVSDSTLYRSLGDSPQYHTFTLIDIYYAVQQVCLYMHDPLEPHFFSLKSILSVSCIPPLSSTTLVYCDNVSVVYLSCNSVQHQRTKLIEIDIYFVRDLVVVGQVRVLHVPSRYQFPDIFTKGLPSALFEEFRSSLSVRRLPAPTAKEC
ncbi:ribonuclease H-like domain-containing protein [Tanacetum coccineum]